MKKPLPTIIFMLIATSSFGQNLYDNYNLNFDDTIGLQHLRIDTITNPNNLWQIGSPQKPVFTNSFSVPNVIVTDTINPYPTNDTSSFVLVNVAEGGGFVWPHTVTFEGQYYVNSDTLTDYGTIEFSPDNGTTWIDLINDTAYTSFYWWYLPKPTLTGNSNGWQNFYVNIANLGPIFGIQDGDTVLYRFTFISDSIQTNKDGIMFDQFQFVDYVEGIEETQNNNLISIYPNPTSDELRIFGKLLRNYSRIQILDYTGQILFDKSNFNGESIDTRQFANGVYFLRYSDTNNYSIKSFVIQH